MSETAAIEACYRAIIEAWNGGDAAGFAARFVEDGAVVGYDGSPSSSRAEILAHLQAIFQHHRPGRFVVIVRDVRQIGGDCCVLRAAVGVIPAGQSEIKPEVNFLQSMVATKTPDGWRAVLLQATPAQFHGRPEEADKLTAELRGVAALA